MYLPVYRWAVESCNILHRDISVNNLMFREEGDHISGVLNDYDMAINTNRDKGGTSKQRTGTRPFLALELLSEDPPPHTFVHDLESLFYCLLWVVTKREHRGYLCHPLQNWEHATLSTLKALKTVVILGFRHDQYLGFRNFGREIIKYRAQFAQASTAMSIQKSIQESRYANDVELLGSVVDPSANLLGFDVYRGFTENWNNIAGKNTSDAHLEERLARLFPDTAIQ